MPDAVLVNLPAEQRATFWREVIEHAEKQSVFVANDKQGDVVGFVNGGLEREGDPVYTAELYALHLLEEQQGNGYGKDLMLALTKKFTEQGHNAMLLWVLSANPARGFYEAMGRKYLKTKLIEIGGESLEEVAYGWVDLSVLAR